MNLMMTSMNIINNNNNNNVHKRNQDVKTYTQPTNAHTQYTHTPLSCRISTLRSTEFNSGHFHFNRCSSVEIW